jgi:hypothetical protein
MRSHRFVIPLTTYRISSKYKVRARAYAWARVALLIHAPRRHIVICGLSCSTTFFAIISWTARFLEKKVSNIKSIFWFSLHLLFWNISRCTKNSTRYCHKMWKCLHVKYPLFLSDFNENWIFSTDFEKGSNIKFHLIRSVGAELFHTDRLTDMTRLTVAFHNFANAPKNNFQHVTKSKGKRDCTFALILVFARQLCVTATYTTLTTYNDNNKNTKSLKPGTKSCNQSNDTLKLFYRPTHICCELSVSIRQ